MNDSQISIYPSTKAYTRADGSIVRHVSNRKYVKKLPSYTEDDYKVIASRQDAGERLSVIAAEYSMTYTRAWAIMKRWRRRHDGNMQHPVNAQLPAADTVSIPQPESQLSSDIDDVVHDITLDTPPIDSMQ